MVGLRSGSHWWLRILGVVLVLIGVLLFSGGIYLIILGGSWYYLLAGAGLAISGINLWRGKFIGVWIYMAVFIATVLWNFYEVGFRFWGSVPRLAAPMVIAFVILLSLNLFPSGQGSDKARRIGRLSGLGLAGVFIVYIAAMFFPHGIVRNDIPVVAGVETERSLSAAGEWLEYGHTGEGVRYSPLDQITKDNVDDLEVIWTAHHGQVSNAAALNEDQNTPLYADGTLYHCAYNNVVSAFDGTTGELKWQFDPHAAAPLWLRCRSIAYVDPSVLPAPEISSVVEADTNNTEQAQENLEQNLDDEGAAAAIETGLGDGGNEETADANASTSGPDVVLPGQTAAVDDECGPRIIMATVDGRLMSIRADNGKLCGQFGVDGIVDLHVGMGNNPPGEYMPTTGAILAGDKIIIGGWVADNRAIGEAPGVVRAFDALTGELVWAWDSGNPNIDKLPPAGESYTRGTPNVWAPISYDLDLNLVYLPTGNPSPDFWGGERSDSDNKYGSSVVAVDLITGKEVWHFQTTHHDLWDYDVPSQPALIDFPIEDGTTVPAVVQLTKRGEIFVLDRRTGEPLTDVEEKPVAQGDARGEYYSPTQPFSVGMPSIGSDEAILDQHHTWGMTPLDHLYCRIRTLKTEWDGHMTPPTTDVYFEFPGNTGGFNWGSASFDQSRNLLVLNNIIWPNRVNLIPQEITNGQDLSGGSEGGPMAGTPYQVFLDYNIINALGTPCFEPPYGTVTAIDMATQEVRWQVPMGTTRNTGPFGVSAFLPFNTGMPTLGGLLTTKPGVSFFAGTQDFYLRAIDTETGEILWKDALPVGSQSVPITYIDDKGRQVIVVQAGGARHNIGARGDYLIAYALKGSE